MTFKSFLVLEPVFIKDYMFSYVTWGNLCSKKNLESQTFVLSPKPVEKIQTNENCRNQPVFPLNIVSYTIKPQDFNLPFLIFHFNVLILKQVIRCKWNCTACILTARTC